MPAYDVHTMLEELKEDAVLPHPVRLRDIILRTRLDPEAALEVNRDFQLYLTHFGEAQKVGASILSRLTQYEPKAL